MPEIGRGKELRAAGSLANLNLHMSLERKRCTEYIRKISGSFIFWIIVYFLIRLVGITNAPLESLHNWRQAFTCMIARNFLEMNPNILYPQIDTSGNMPGYVGSEFPVFNYIIFIVARVFGYQHWYGRLINLLVSSIGIYFFYCLTEKYMGKKVAFASGIILLSSIWFSFSRKIMPDTFSVSLMFVGLYFCYHFINKGSRIHLYLFILFASLGSLAKLPTISFLGLIIIPLFRKEQSVHIKEGLILGVFLVSLVTSAWYLYWIPKLVETYNNQLFYPKSVTVGFMELIRQWPHTLEKFYFSSFHSFIAFACFLAGIYFMIRDKNKLPAFAFLLFFLVFSIFILKFGDFFSSHSYYIIPFTPMMAIMAGYAVSRIPSRFYFILLFFIAIEGILNQQHDFFIRESQAYKLNLEQIADSVSNRSDLIMINDNGSPQMLYFTHRKGWSVHDEILTDDKKILSFIEKGARYLIIDKKFAGVILLLSSDRFYLAFFSFYSSSNF